MQGSSISGDDLDRIGAIGESAFENLCHRVKLKCSRVFPDRTGKDFVVEFPLAPSKTFVSIDKRPPPIQVLVQVKTILAKNDKATLSLSVAERLAKDTRPAVVAILRIDDEDEIVDLHLVHIVDDQLARVLKALRKATTQPDPKLHQMTISFRTRNAEPIPRTRPDFYAAIASLPCGDMLAYAETKKRQLQELGFTANRIKMSFTLSATPEDIIDGFLAQKPLAIKDVVFLERRFDIELPVETIRSATLELGETTHMTGRCVIRSDATDTLREAFMAAEFTYVPDFLVAPNHFALSVRTKYGHFIIKPGSWTFKSSPEYNADSQHTLDEWVGYLELSILVSRARFSMELFSDVSADPLVFNISDVPEDLQTFAEKRYLRLLVALRELCDAAGLRKMRFTLGEASTIRDQLSLIRKTMDSVTATFQSTSSDPAVPKLNGEKGALVCPVKILSDWIGFFMPVIVTTEVGKGETIYTGKQIKRAVVERLPSEDVEGAFDKFRAKYCDLMDVRIAFIQKPGNFMVEEIGMMDLREDKTD